MDPITTGIALQAATGIGKSIFGLSQRSKSKKALAELNKKQLANQYIPSAIIQAAREPISQEFIEAQSMGDQRRTAQGIGAASLAGSRGVTAVLPSLLESERVSEVNRNALYNQARVEAQKQLGTYQEALRQERGDIINQGIAAQSARLGAGQENLFNGLMDIGTSGVYLADKYSGKKIFEGKKTSNTSGATSAANGLTMAMKNGFNNPPLKPNIMSGLDMRGIDTNNLYYDPVNKEWVDRNPFLRSNNYLGLGAANASGAALGEVASDAANAKNDSSNADGFNINDYYYDRVKRQWIKRSTIENPFLRSNNYLAQ